MLHNHNKSGQKPKLDSKRIVDVALKIARSDGLENLSMRRVATHLETGPMSLYNHVKNREDLIAKMVDAVALQIDAPEPRTLPPRAEATAIAMAGFKVVSKENWIVHHLLTGGRGSLLVVPLIERIMFALEKSGIKHDRVAEAFETILHLVYAAALARVRPQKDLKKPVIESTVIASFVTARKMSGDDESLEQVILFVIGAYAASDAAAP